MFNLVKSQVQVELIEIASVNGNFSAQKNFIELVNIILKSFINKKLKFFVSNLEKVYSIKLFNFQKFKSWKVW